MMTLDEQLNEVAKELRSAAHSVPHRPWVAPGSKLRGRQAAAALSAAAVVIALIALPVGLLGGSGDVDQSGSPVGAGGVTQPTEAATPTTTPEAVVTTLAPVEATGEASEMWDALGVTAEGWTPIEALHEEDGSVVLYDSADGGTERVAIEIWADLTGTEAGSGYEHALEALVFQGGNSLGEVALWNGDTAVSFPFTDPNTGSEGFAFLWRVSPTVSAEVLAYVATFEEATAIVESIEPLSDYDWNTILDQTNEDSTTPTSIVP